MYICIFFYILLNFFLLVMLLGSVNNKIKLLIPLRGVLKNLVGLLEFFILLLVFMFVYNRVLQQRLIQI